MKIISEAPWRNVKCPCGTGLQIDLSDIRTDGKDDEGDPLLYVTCPRCRQRISMTGRGVPSSHVRSLEEAARWDDLYHDL